MKWENLREMLCPYPYCEKLLYEQGEEVKCTKCYFHMTKEKFIGTLQHRAFPDRPHKKNRWQNLREDRCPMQDCNYRLTPSMEGRLDMMKCCNPECVFKITMERFNIILGDQSHAANIFKDE